MDIVIIGGLLAAPIAAFLVVLLRARAMRPAAFFLAAVAAIVAIALLAGYQDYRASSDELVHTGLRFNLAVFAALGLVVCDWMAVAWGAGWWLRRRRAGAPSMSRAERRREARRVAGQGARVAK